MKNAPGAVTIFVNANNVGWRADLYTLTLLSGAIYRWTTCDRSLLVSGNTYLADGTVLRRGNLRQSSKLQIDNLEVQLAGAALIGGKTVALQAAQGYFDGARLQIDHIVGAFPGDISLGPVLAWFEGSVAGVEPGPLVTRMRVESELAALNLALPRFNFQLACGNAVYDPNCTLVKATFTLTGTASGVPTTTTIPTTTAALTAKASGYFNLGVLAFTSGSLNGVRRAIQNWASNTFTLGIPLPSSPAAGDGISVYPGCQRDSATCNTKFANLGNFRGFPHIPTPSGGY